MTASLRGTNEGLDENAEAFYNKRWLDAVENDDVPVDRLRMSEIDRACDQAMRDRNTLPSIVDVGCGTGWISQQLASRGSVTGIDTSSSAIEIARKQYSEPAFQVADITASSPNAVFGSFDLAVCSEVIEHLPDSRKPLFVQRLCSLIKPGGHLVITTPNALVWDAYWKTPDCERWRQPVEDWCTPAQLHGLLAPYCRSIKQDTFNWRFTRKGAYRLLGSRKLERALSWIRCGGLFDRLRRRRAGLYIVGLYERLAD